MIGAVQCWYEEKAKQERKEGYREEEKALLWSVTGIAASSFTLDLIQPLQDKAVSTIPFLLRNTQHKALIEVNRRCKAVFLMVRRLEVELYLRDGGGFRCSYRSDLLMFQLCGRQSWENVGKRAIGKNEHYVTWQWTWRCLPKASICCARSRPYWRQRLLMRSDENLAFNICLLYIHITMLNFIHLNWL